MLKKYLQVILFIVLIFVFIYTNISYATVVSVTNENLNETLQKFASAQNSESNYKITVANNVININSDGEIFKINYDLTTEKPTFTFEIPIEKGMSYEDFKNQTDEILLPMIGYIAVVNIQGVEFEDVGSYFLFSYLENAFENYDVTDSGYTIIDDTKMADGVVINKDESDSKTIYVSDFGEKVIEYVNEIYKNKQIITDSSEENINSYELVIEKKNLTSTSCKLVSTMSVNLNADYSKIKGYKKSLDKNDKEDNNIKDSLDENNKDTIEKIENITNLDVLPKNEETNVVADKEVLPKNEETNIVANIEALPKTGENQSSILNILYTIIGTCTIGIVALIYVSKRNE